MSRGPMYEDYNDNTYDLQYADDHASGGVQLSHNTLYITTIPKALTRDGLKVAFGKFGNITKVFLSTDPRKRFAMITFETASEAKLAMMKLNQTEPLRLTINIAHQSTKKDNSNGVRERRYSSQRDASSSIEDRSYGRLDRNLDEMGNGDNDFEDVHDENLMAGLEPTMEEKVRLEMEIERLRLKRQKIETQEAEIECQQRMLLLNSKKAITSSMNTNANRSILPDGRIVVRTSHERNESEYVGSGAGDSKDGESVCSCKAKVKWWETSSSSDDGTSTPSTCVLCSEDRSDTRTYEDQDKSELTSRTDTRKSHTRIDSKYTAKLTNTISKSVINKVTDTSNRSEYSKTDVSKASDVTSKKNAVKRLAKRNECTCEFKYNDIYSDSDNELDETNRLIQFRCTDYLDVVEDHLRVIIALAGYPKAKMKLQQMDLFQKSINDVMDMQLKAGLLKKTPSFIDCYLNRGAIVCICKDLETRDWIVRVSPGLQERMCSNLILLKARVKRLCLAVLKIPHTCWPTTAQDAFKLLQYFNPTLRTNLWRIYSQKTVGNVECTSFFLDRISGEFIRGPSFKNIIDYSQMEFELTGYSEIYYECFLSGMDEDLRSVASRVKLLDDLRSNGSTPRNNASNENKTTATGTKKDLQEKGEADSMDIESDEIVDLTSGKNIGELQDNAVSAEEVKQELENTIKEDILRKLKDVTYVSDKDEVIIWNEDTRNIFGIEPNVNLQIKESETNNNHMIFDLNEVEKNDNLQRSTLYASDNNESIYESNETLMSRNSNVNIDSNRGMAYYRRTNYLHVENELKIAICLVGYPQDKLEGTHIRRLKQLFKEYLHKDMKSQRFANLIIPKFQDVYLSNGAVIYVCDSLETRDYLTEILPKFINATGLKLVFRNITDLVRYTRIVMRLPEKLAHVESVEILHKLQTIYSNLKPDCWKYYSDIAGKQKRQFGVDPESLEVIRSPDFDPVYNEERICFRIIDRQKRDVNFEETIAKVNEIESVEKKQAKEHLLKYMYCPIDPELMNSPLTRIRTNHYTDLIADDLKLYVGPSNYPETRIDEPLFHSIKRTFENVVFKTMNEQNLKCIPKIHDMYLFDGVIFIICKDMYSRKWIESSLNSVNLMLELNLKATEFRGAVGIISMVVKTDKDTDEVIEILQKQNPRLRTKYWRKISTVRSKGKLDVVLQIDKLSAEVINRKDFNKMIGENAVHFTLGHLQSLLKPKASLEEICKRRDRKLLKDIKTRTDVGSQADTGLINSNKCIHDKVDRLDNASNVNEDKSFTYYNDKDFDPKIINSDSPKSPEITYNFDNNQENYCKVIMKIPLNILPENKDDLNIIFDLLEDKNPGLNTELWQVSTDLQYAKGKIVVHIDRQSALVMKGKNFDPVLAGEKLRFVMQNA